MTISVLDGFDKVTAAGILARAALALEDSSNPAAEVRLPEESSIRNRLFDQVRHSLGIKSSAYTPTDVEKIVDALDNESERLLDPIDQPKVLDSLSAKGQLPADLYDVVIDEGLLEYFGKKSKSESLLIERAIKFRDAEQHFTQTYGELGEFPLISLFSKRVENRFPAKSFTLLVAGLRNGTLLHVSQAWRIYDDSAVNLGSAETLLDLLKRFAEVYGVVFTLSGRSGKFFLQSSVDGRSIEDSIDIELKEEPGREKRFKIVVSDYKSRTQDGKNLGSLVYAIDLIKYGSALKAHGWDNEKFEDLHTPMGDWQKNTNLKKNFSPF